jgi:hypothetical protein
LRVGIVQSAYMPWRGFFDFIQSSDLFVIYDDVQYSKGTWRNRNRLKTPRGLRWLTVPVHAHVDLTIEEVKIAQSDHKPWQPAHRRLLEESLRPAPHFEEARALWEEAVSVSDPTISVLNVRLIRIICDYLDIKTPIVMSSTYPVEGVRSERLVRLLTKLGASTYLSGPTAAEYLDEDLFRDRGIRLEYKSYVYPPYPQLWGPFESGVSVLDLIANVGRQARSFMNTLEPDRVAVE